MLVATRDCAHGFGIGLGTAVFQRRLYILALAPYNHPMRLLLYFMLRGIAIRPRDLAKSSGLMAIGLTTFS